MSELADGTSRIIRVKPFGRSGNQMIQAIHGIACAQAKGHHLRVSANPPYLPPLNLDFSNGTAVGESYLDTFYLGTPALGGFSMTVDEEATVARRFLTPRLKVKPVESDASNLVAHLRSGDIMQPHTAHAGYMPLPLCFYRKIMEDNRFSRMTIVTEPDRLHPCLEPLVREYAAEVVVDLVDGFARLLGATNLAIGISTFSGAAALCSLSLRRLFCADLGLNPFRLDASVPEPMFCRMQLYRIAGLDKVVWKATADQLQMLVEYPSESCDRVDWDGTVQRKKVIERENVIPVESRHEGGISMTLPASTLRCAKEASLKISFCTPAKGRTEFLRRTYLDNVKHGCDSLGHVVEFVLINLDSPDDMDEWARDEVRVLGASVAYYRAIDRYPQYSIAQADNTAMRAASGTVVSNLMADALLSRDYFLTLPRLIGEGAGSRIVAAPAGAPRDTSGLITLHRADFDRLGGYDEDLIGWGYQDFDLIARARLAGLRRILWTAGHCSSLAHPDALRVRYSPIESADPNIFNDLNVARSRINFGRGLTQANAGRSWGAIPIERVF